MKKREKTRTESKCPIICDLLCFLIEPTVFILPNYKKELSWAINLVLQKN